MPLSICPVGGAAHGQDKPEIWDWYVKLHIDTTNAFIVFNIVKSSLL